VKGTCQGFFTYTKNQQWHDEQDIEVLGVSLMAPATSPAPQPAGMQMTAYDPA
jgi:beta-glucanase (GH16 family)